MLSKYIRIGIKSVLIIPAFLVMVIFILPLAFFGDWLAEDKKRMGTKAAIGMLKEIPAWVKPKEG